MVDFGGVAGGFVDRIFSGILIFGIVTVVVLAIAGTLWFFLVYRRKFDIDVKLTSKRAGDRDYIVFDRAAILADKKSKAKYLKLWSQKIELKLPTFNILQRSNRGDYLEILREGENRFYYQLPPKVDRKVMVRSDGSMIPIAEQSTKLIDPEMEYWSTKRKGMNKGMFDQEQVWMKLVPYIPQLLAGVFIVFILWIFMRYLPQILQQLQELTSELNRQQTAQVVTGIFMALI